MLSIKLALELAVVGLSFHHNLSAQEEEALFKHNNEVAFVLDGAAEASITVEPAGLVFNDILEYSLQVSDQFPWDDGEQEALGTSLAGASFNLQLGNIEGAAFESPWPGDSWELLVPPLEVNLLLGMLGYGRYRIDINGLVFYLNTTDGRWNWAYFKEDPRAGDIQFWIRQNGVFLETKRRTVEVHQNDEFTTWELFGYDRNRDYTTWAVYGNTWYFAFNGNSIPAAGTPSSVSQFLLDVNAQFKTDISVAAGKTLSISSFEDQNDNWIETNLEFDSGKKLIVNGTLNVNGELSANVLFDRSGSSGTWDGIQFNSGSSGTLDYATIQHASKGIYIDHTNAVTVNHCTIENFTEQGIYAYATSASIENSTLQNPSGASHGIYVKSKPAGVAAR